MDNKTQVQLKISATFKIITTYTQETLLKNLPLKNLLPKLINSTKEELVIKYLPKSLQT